MNGISTLEKFMIAGLVLVVEHFHSVVSLYVNTDFTII